jgi:NAD(P)-dependent dehydrogenase (short-subunit alcohol dehydrogenase family)
VRAEKGVVDIVVANAGFIEHATIFDLSEAHYDKTMDINVKGVVFTVQKALPLMTRGGSIVVVSSVINVKGVPAHGTYAAAKAGVRALVRVWAQEFKDKGIRVNALSPGATETPIIRGQFRQGRVRRDDATWPSRPAGRTRRGRLFPGVGRVKLRHRHRSARRWRPGPGLTPGSSNGPETRARSVPRPGRTAET